MVCQLVIGIIGILTTGLAVTMQLEGQNWEQLEETYYYELLMRRKYLSMKFNDYVRVDGDPTENDITVTWLQNITRSMNMEVLYIVQTLDGDEIISKSFDLPTLCSGPFFYNSWDRNIINIYMRGVTANTGCPIQSGTITPPSTFNVELAFDHKVTCQMVHIIIDLYPFNEMESIIMLVLEGKLDSLYDC